MKQAIKLTLITLLALSFAACKGTKSTSTSDSTKVIDSTKTTVVDTVKKDTTKKDTAKKM
jgi:ABC-type oligopeptide transport system substrate-binding subunit